MFENGDLWKMVKEQQVQDWMASAEKARLLRALEQNNNHRSLRERALHRFGEYLESAGNRLQERYGDCREAANLQSQHCAEQTA